MNAILLSAGFGTRFRPYTNSFAKPSIPFLNIPLIGYSLYYAQKFSADQATINTHHLPESIKIAVAKISDCLDIKINYIDEQPKILDSGGGIKNAKSHLNANDHFLVINTDVPHVLPNFNFDDLLKNHKEQNALCTLITCDLKNHDNSRGVWTKKIVMMLHILVTA